MSSSAPFEHSSSWTHPDDEQRELFADPSVSNWDREIYRTVAGRRDYVTIGAVEYMARTLALFPKDAELARRNFREALRAYVGEWQPGELQSPFEMAYVLDLIAAYTPATGFAKVIGHINRHGRFHPAGYPASQQEIAGDLHMKALKALESYYPGPPAWKEPNDAGASGYTAYINLLEAHASEPRYAVYQGYAAARLIELDRWSADDRRMGSMIAANPQCLTSLLSFLMRYGRPDTYRSRDLTAIYMHCHPQSPGPDDWEDDAGISTSLLNELLLAMKRLGATIDPNSLGLLVRRSATDTVQIRVSPMICDEFCEYTDDPSEATRRFIEQQAREFSAINKREKILKEFDISFTSWTESHPSLTDDGSNLKMASEERPLA